MTNNGTSREKQLSKVLEQYVKEIYILILGLGFALFVSTFTANAFAGGAFNLSALVYFGSLYFFLTYDWIAYNLLMEKFPYRLAYGLSSFGRFYADLTALLIKTFLIYLSTQEVNFIHTIAGTLLFALWHLTIICWHRFAQREYTVSRTIWQSHLFMVFTYLWFAEILFLSHSRSPFLPAQLRIQIWLLILCGIIVIHAAWRKVYLLNGLMTNDLPPMSSASEVSQQSAKAPEVHFPLPSALLLNNSVNDPKGDLNNDRKT